MNYAQDFKDYAIMHLNISSTQFHDWEVLQDKLYGTNAGLMTYGPMNSMTPYILEERELRAVQMDIFSRMMMDRILWLAGPVNDRMSNIVAAQLLYLDNCEEKEILIYIDSPGGSVKSGLTIVDTMNYISSDIITVNTGMAASMGSILLGAGTKGKRYALPNSRVMLHQVSTGASGNIQDVRRSIEEGEKYNEKLFALLGSYTDKTAKQVLKDADRDLWLNAEEAKAYGIIDDIITKKIKK
jgi:ATP-dependent Clp protease protease subunit